MCLRHSLGCAVITLTCTLTATSSRSAGPLLSAPGDHASAGTIPVTGAPQHTASRVWLHLQAILATAGVSLSFPPRGK